MSNPELVNQAPNTITVWSDIGCPWATLALGALRNAIQIVGSDKQIDHRVFPLEIFNQRPTPKRITDAEVVAIAGLIPDLGWNIWSKPDWNFAVTMIPAMEAVQAAKHPDVGGLTASDELDAALRKAFWCDSRCISIGAEIMRAAETCSNVNVEALQWAITVGEGRWRIRDQWPVAQSQLVTCSPHIFSPSGVAVANPGASYTWAGGAETGYPRMESYDESWTRSFIDLDSGSSDLAAK